MNVKIKKKGDLTLGNIFNNFSGNPMMEKQMHQSRFNAARTNLILVVAFSLFNLIALATNSGYYFLFSLSIPYLLTDIGMFFTGMYPDEFYTGEYAGMLFADKSLFWGMLIVSILILGIYTLLFFLSKKNDKMLKVALVLFCLDTAVMLLNYGFSAIVDLAFHVWVIVILAMGVKASKKLKELAETEPLEAEFTDLGEDGEPKNSPILRPADMEAKSRVLLDAEVYNYTIIYRRVKKTNELVINGNVYAEYIATAEFPHELSATVDGHRISCGMEMNSHSFIRVDGETIKRKLRLV